VAGGATFGELFSGGEPPDSGPGVGVGVGLGFAVSPLSRFVSSSALEEDSDLERSFRGGAETAVFKRADSEEECVWAGLLAKECLLLDFRCRLGVGLGSVLASWMNAVVEPFIDHAGNANGTR